MKQLVLKQGYEAWQVGVCGVDRVEGGLVAKFLPSQSEAVGLEIGCWGAVSGQPQVGPYRFFYVAHRDLCTRDDVGACASVQQVETRND